MAWNYEKLKHTPIENVIVEKGFDDDGIHKVYRLQAEQGYSLNDKELAYFDYDENGNVVPESMIRGYTTGTVSCGASYDFTENPREFFAILETEIEEGELDGD